MKIVTVHEWDGIVLSLFRMDAGDRIERHQHPFVHTTGVASGKSRVSVFHRPEPDVFTMIPGDRDFAFPPDIAHEIEALEDGTIIVNLSRTNKQPGQPGGIVFVDGTIA